MTRSLSVAVVTFNTIVLMNRFHDAAKPKSSLIESLIGKEVFSSPRRPSSAEAATKAQIVKICTSMTVAIANANGWKRAGYHPVQLDLSNRTSRKMDMGSGSLAYIQRLQQS